MTSEPPSDLPSSSALPTRMIMKPSYLIADECDSVKELLLKKNEAYGNSALDPVRIFSKASPVEQIRVRIDDKLSRLARGHALDNESLGDTIQDLIGYLILYRVAKRVEAPDMERSE